MIKYILQPYALLLLTMLTFEAYCDGQIKTNLSAKTGLQRKAFITGQPKLIKTLGSDQYQNINCGLQDRKGNLWFGTSAEGVYKYDGKLFTQLTVKDGLNSNKIRSVLEDNAGNIWFGTVDGICIYNGENIIRVPIAVNFMPAIGSNDYYYNESSTKKTVWSMLQDKSGRFWFGTGDGVYCYDGKKFTRFLDDRNLLNKDSVKLKMVANILQDKNGNIWFASGMPPGMEGICFYDGKTLESFKPKKETWIRKIIEEKNGNLLFATRHTGVLKYDFSANKTEEKSFVNFSKPTEILNNSLTDILADKKGDTWISCDYGNSIGDSLGGVWRYSASALKESEKVFTKLSSAEACFMMEDRAGNIWIGTRNTGLYCFDGKSFIGFSE